MTTSHTDEVMRRAYELINTGREKFGSFWENKTATATCLHYGRWSDVPEDIRVQTELIGRNARERNQQKKKSGHTPNQRKKVTSSPHQKHTGLLLTDDVLLKIWEGAQLVPRIATKLETKLIRYYITRRAGLDPKVCLLGLNSRMEK